MRGRNLKAFVYYEGVDFAYVVCEDVSNLPSSEYQDRLHREHTAYTLAHSSG